MQKSTFNESTYFMKYKFTKHFLSMKCLCIVFFNSSSGPDLARMFDTPVLRIRFYDILPCNCMLCVSETLSLLSYTGCLRKQPLSHSTGAQIEQHVSVCTYLTKWVFSHVVVWGSETSLNSFLHTHHMLSQQHFSAHTHLFRGRRFLINRFKNTLFIWCCATLNSWTTNIGVTTRCQK